MTGPVWSSEQDDGPALSRHRWLKVSLPTSHYGVVKLLALIALSGPATDIAGPGKLNADHSPDHNRPRQSATLCDLAE
jgi:hypothetical protein